ncbi:hypothetical protein ACU8KH_04072 [Lachancea thermotolerans]
MNAFGLANYVGAGALINPGSTQHLKPKGNQKPRHGKGKWQESSIYPVKDGG